MQNPVVVCADIGSVAKRNFGWWSSRGVEGNEPSTLAQHVAAMLNSGLSVALGLECPLFVPVVEKEKELTRARPGEGRRPWSAGAGAAVLATGVVQTTWLLKEIRREPTIHVPAFLSWSSFVASGRGLFLWEAFVTGDAKRKTHRQDARAAAKAFMQALPDPTRVNQVKSNSGVLSLVGATLLHTGWVTDLDILHEPCLVVKAIRRVP